MRRKVNKDEPLVSVKRTYKLKNPGIGKTPKPTSFSAVPVRFKPRGATPREIDWDQVEKLATIHCTPDEISWFLQIPVATLESNETFKRIYQRSWALGRISVRRWQYRVAELEAQEGKQCKMLVHLGKHILNQRDTVQHEHTGPNGDPIPLKTERQDIKRLSTPELETLQKLIEKITVIPDAENVDFDDLVIN